jgi:hypothetical protein
MRWTAVSRCFSPPSPTATFGISHTSWSARHHTGDADSTYKSSNDYGLRGSSRGSEVNPESRVRPCDGESQPVRPQTTRTLRLAPARLEVVSIASWARHARPASRGVQ